jgi:hypothetical protein
MEKIQLKLKTKIKNKIVTISIAMLLLSMIMVGAAGAATNTSGENLILNPGFESGTAGNPNNWWIYDVSGISDIYPGPGRISGNSIGIKTSGIRNNVYWGQNIPINSTKKYELSAYVQTQQISGNGIIVGLDWFDKADNYLGNTNLPAIKGTTPWTYYTKTNIIPLAKSAKVNVILQSAFSSGTVYFDDISLKEVVPTATPKPTVTATVTPTATPIATPKPTVTATATPTATPKPAVTATATSTATPKPAVTATATSTATPKPSVTATATSTATPTATPKPTVTATPTATPKPTVTATPKPTPTPVPISTSALTPPGQNVIDWSGYKWDVRTGTGGPGTNSWTNKNVWVDSQNRLHLKITNVNGKWYCAELSTQIPVSYGTYTFNVANDPSVYADNVVAGLFYYLSDKDEIDIEFSRWNLANTPNTQYTVWGPRGGIESARYETNAQNTTHKFVWSPSSINFQSVGIGTWNYNGYIPTPKGVLDINLWLFNNPEPKDGKEQELILNSVQYVLS